MDVGEAQAPGENPGTLENPKLVRPIAVKITEISGSSPKSSGSQEYQNYIK